MGLLVVWRIASATALVVSAVSGKAVGQPQQLPGITITAPPAPNIRSAPTPAITTASPATVASTTTPIADPSAIEAIDPRANNVGVAQSGSQGVVPREELEARPIYRTVDMLESVPGLVVTQHSGEGKANQYFLRGFNLDHGTDLAITYDGMPVNMRTARAMPTPPTGSANGSFRHGYSANDAIANRRVASELLRAARAGLRDVHKSFK